ncbi:MAG: peptidase M16 [Rhodospirillaceae bacterium]|nr:peptidase M16 [Rhodospirillaceae bacterium]
MPDIEVTKLKNGIRVVSEKDNHFDTISVGIWVDVGSRNESEGLNGISHLLEHMAFKGTKNRNAKQIVQEIENVGGYFNAYTSRENTAYYIKILKKDLMLAVNILIDIFINSTFEKLELEKEKYVIKQEIGQSKDTPDDIIFDYFQSIAFPDQPIGRSILGTSKNVQSFTRKNIIEYLNSEYIANRVVFSASGDINHSDFVNSISTRLNDYNTSNKAKLDGAKYTGGDYRESRDLEQVHIILGMEGVPYKDDYYFTSQVFSSVLGGGMSSKLFQEIRENRGLCYSVYSFVSSYIDTGLVGIYAGTGENKVEELIPSIIEEIHKMTYQISVEDIDRAKAQLKASIIMSQENTSSRCETAARQLIVHGRPVPNSEIIKQIELVDRDTVLNFAKKILTESLPSFSAIGPINKIEKFDKIVDRLRL